MDWLLRLRGEDPAGARGRAAALVNEAVALSEAGRHAEAAAAEKQAVRLLRATRRAPRAEIAPLLARALLYQSGSLAALGDLAGALRDAEEALELAQEVAATGHGPPESLPLTQANLAARLLQSGRAADAEPHARAAAASTADLPEQAAAWIRGTLAQVLAAVGEDAEASAVSDQTRIALQRRVGAAAADSGLDVEQARALTNHANRLLRAGRWQEAVDTVTEAVAVRRTLAARNRLAQLPGLAMTLTNQAIMLSKIARWEESLAAAEEAVALQREISTVDPVAGRSGLASALSSYATGLAAEAVAICREAVGANRDRELSGLATALNQQADRILAQPAVSVRQAESAAALRSEAAALLAERDRG